MPAMVKLLPIVDFPPQCDVVVFIAQFVATGSWIAEAARIGIPVCPIQRRAIGCLEVALQVFSSMQMEEYSQAAMENLELAKDELRKLNQTQ